ncbi:O-methyltransferase [candidate division KSB1 bacterium]
MIGFAVVTLGLLVFPGISAQNVRAVDLEPEVLDYLDVMRAEQGRMHNVPEVDGRFLRAVVLISKAQRVLEIGTSNGYSAIWLGLGLSETGGRLTTIEIDENRHRLAEENFHEAGMANIIEAIRGDAFDVVPTLDGGFDLAFIDLGRGGLTRRAFDMVLPKMKPGGIILCHAVGFRGLGVGGDMRSFVEYIENDPRLETFVIPMSRPGISLSIVRSVDDR